MVVMDHCVLKVCVFKHTGTPSNYTMGVGPRTMHFTLVTNLFALNQIIYMMEHKLPTCMIG